MKRIIVIIAVFVSLYPIYGISGDGKDSSFTNINSGLPGVRLSNAEWADYDNDGDLDIVIGGYSDSGELVEIYRNDSGVFVDINAGLDEVAGCIIACGDYDNDGDLDIFLAGDLGLSNTISKIYRNDSGAFNDIGAGLAGVYTGTASWGDYDNDGDLDLVYTGSDSSGSPLTKLYRNNSGVFTSVVTNLPNIANGSVSWGDYDSDGDIDILINGYNSDWVEESEVFRNDSGVFTDINAGLKALGYSTSAWGDYDNDGDLDILLTGATSDIEIFSLIYRNNSGVFTDIGAGLFGVFGGSSDWGDFNNDGDLDILLTGYHSIDFDPFSKVLRNTTGVFTDIGAELIGVADGSAGWGDYDNDGDLDIVLNGSSSSELFTEVYRNNSLTANTVPNAPLNLTSLINGNNVTFSWNKSTDTQTPQNGLSYNMYVGITSHSGSVKPPMSNTSTGYRKVVSFGNINEKNSYTIKNLPDGKYYWSVQAADNAFAGSLFSSERSFFKGTLSVPSNVVISNDGTKVTVSWNAVQYAESYIIYASSDPYGVYSDVSSSGTFDGTSWSQVIGGNKLFYKVSAAVE